MAVAPDLARAQAGEDRPIAIDGAALAGARGPVEVTGRVTGLGAGDEQKIIAALELDGVAGPRAEGIARGPQGSFELAIPTRRPLLAGRYEVVVRAGEASARRALAVGDDRAAAAAREATRTVLVRHLEWLRRAFTALEQRASYIARQRAAGAPPDPDAARGDFEALRAGLVRNLIVEARRGLRDMRTGATLLPFGAQHRAATGLAAAIERAAGARHDELVAGEPSAAAREARAAVLAAVAGIIEALAEGAPASRALELAAWETLALAEPEKGDLAARPFRGETTGFSLAPPEGWTLARAPTRHEARLLLRPPADAAPACWAVVEVREVTLPAAAGDAAAASDRDLLDALARAVEVTAWERFTSYRRGEGRAVLLADETMPEGNRAAYDLRFTAELGEGEARATYHGRSREVLSRDGRRLIGLIVLGPPEQLEAISAQADALIESFAIHD